MRGYDLDEYEDYDDYEEEGSGQEDEYEEEEEQEEAPKPTAEELKYLELRQKLKESYRQKMQKGASGSQDKKKAPDNFGSFFGPSKPVIAQRVIQDTKPLLENQHLAARVLARQNSKKSSSAPSGSKPAPRPQTPRVSQLKQKVEKMKSTRDYSFLLSEDAELPAPTRKPLPQSVSTPRTEAQSAKLPLRGKQTSVANGRPISKGIEERRSVSSNGHVNPRPGPNKLPSSSKQLNVSAARQLNSNGGTGPGRPPVQNGLQSRKPVALSQKPSLPNGRTAVPASVKPPAAKMQPGASKHPVEQRKADQRRDPREANRAEPTRDPYRGEPRRDPRELKRGELRRDPRELNRGEARKDPREVNKVEQRRASHQPNRVEQRRDSHLPNKGDQRRDSHLPNRVDQRRDSHQPSRGEPRRDLHEPIRAKIPSKTPVSSSKPQIQSQMRKPLQKHMSSQVSSRDQKPKKRLARPLSDDEDEGAMAISMIRKMFGYNPNKYAGRDEDTRGMETGFADLEREEKRSARIAREEDEEQLRLIEEEERRERMRKAKRRKMG